MDIDDLIEQATALAPLPPLDAPRSNQDAADDPHARLLQSYGVNVGNLDELNEARQKHEQRAAEPEWNLGRHLVRMLPGVSSYLNAAQETDYQRALRRFHEGNPEPGDTDRIAEWEANQQQDANRGFVGKALGALESGVAIGGEMLSGGAAMEGAASLAPRALGWLARPAAVEGSTVLGRIGTAARSPAAWGRAAVTGATTPAMILPELTNANTNAGRDPLDPRGLPAAIGLAGIQAAIFGSLGRNVRDIGGVGVLGALQRAGAGGAAMAIEQQAADVIRYAVGQSSRYGTMDDALHGKLGDAIEEAAIQWLTGAAFVGMHGARGAANDVLDAYHAELDRMARQGVVRDTAGRRMAEAWGAIEPALHEPTQEGGLEELVSHIRNPQVRGIAERMAEVVKPPEAPEQAERSPESTQTAVPPVLQAFTDALDGYRRAGRGVHAATLTLHKFMDKFNAALRDPDVTNAEIRQRIQNTQDPHLQRLAESLLAQFPDRAGSPEQAQPLESLPQAPGSPLPHSEPPADQLSSEQVSPPETTPQASPKSPRERLGELESEHLRALARLNSAQGMVRRSQQHLQAAGLGPGSEQRRIAATQVAEGARKELAAARANLASIEKEQNRLRDEVMAQPVTPVAQVVSEPTVENMHGAAEDIGNHPLDEAALHSLGHSIEAAKNLPKEIDNAISDLSRSTGRDKTSLRREIERALSEEPEVLAANAEGQGGQANGPAASPTGSAGLRGTGPQAGGSADPSAATKRGTANGNVVSERRELEAKLRQRGLNPKAIESRVEQSGATSAAEWDMWARENNAYPGDALKHEYARMLASRSEQVTSGESPAARLKDVKDKASADMEKTVDLWRQNSVPHDIQRRMLDSYNHWLKHDPELAGELASLLKEMSGQKRFAEMARIMSSPQFQKEFENGVREHATRRGLGEDSIRRILLGRNAESAQLPQGSTGRRAQATTQRAAAQTEGQLTPAQRMERVRRGREVPRRYQAEAQEVGIEPDALHGLAEHLRAMDKEGIAEHNALYKSLRSALARMGYSGGKLARIFKSGGDADQVRGIDEITGNLDGPERATLASMARSNPGVHETDIIFDVVKRGPRQPLSEDGAYRQAFDHLRRVKESARTRPEELTHEVADVNRQLHAIGDKPVAAEDIARLQREAQAEGLSESARRAAAAKTPADQTEEGPQAQSDTHVDNDGNLRDANGDILFGPGAGTIGAARSGSAVGIPGGAQSAGAQSGGGRSGRIGPFEIIATVKRLFNMPVYVEGHLQANANALYRVKPEAAEVSKMAAGTAPYYVHELAHHLEKILDLHLYPGTMPTAVKLGFQQFDYVQYRPNVRLAMHEGFAEWLRRREVGQLQNLTPEQQAAANYAENMLSQRKGVIDKLDRVRDLFSDFANQTGSERFAGLLGSKEQRARPQVTPGETVQNYLQRTREAAADNLLDDALPAKRAERAAEARGEVFAPGTKLSEVVATTRLRNVPDANEMEQGGVFAYDHSGKHKVLSAPLAEAIRGLSAEEAAPGGELDRMMPALRVLHDLTTGAVARSGEAADGAHATIKELMQDPQKFLRLEEAAQKVTGLFNATLKAMVMSGRMTPERADYLIKQHPFYVSEQHITEPDFRSVPPFGGRRRGEEPRTASFLKQRTGSGEQMVNWLEALRDRFRFTASMVNDQAKFRALLDLSQREGVGQWLNPGQPGEGQGRPLGWPKDGTKPSITGYVGGEPVTIRVNDRPFYEMVTGTQGESGTVQPFFRALGDVLQATRIPQAVRLGGTILAPVWHLKNFVRDPILYAMRTISDKGTIRNLGDLFNWYGKSISFYARALAAGGADRVELTRASDAYFKLMERMSGRELSFGAESNKQTFASRVMDGWHGFFQRVSDLLTAGEKGTRVLELKNVWDKLGITEEWLNQELAKNPDERNPVPFAAQVAALDIASQITHNVHQQGIHIRQLNRSWPFLGAHIAGVYKDISNAVMQPKKVMGALAILAMAKGVEWLINKDDREWQELPDHYRFGFSFKTPVGWMHLPAPRGIAGGITGAIDNMTRASSASNPRFAGLLKQGLQEIAPHGGPEPLATAANVIANRDWLGRHIIPEHEASNLGIAGRLTHPRALAYEASQLTGGVLDSRRLNPNPFSMTQHPQQSVSDLQEAFYDMQSRRSAYAAGPGRRGLAFPQEQQYQTLLRAHSAITRLRDELNGVARVGRSKRDLEPPSEDRQQAIRRRIVDVARQALGVR